MSAPAKEDDMSPVPVGSARGGTGLSTVDHHMDGMIRGALTLDCRPCGPGLGSVKRNGDPRARGRNQDCREQVDRHTPSLTCGKSSERGRNRGGDDLPRLPVERKSRRLEFRNPLPALGHTLYFDF